MTIELAVDLLRNTLYTCLILVSPIVCIAVIVGVAVSLIQSVTSIQEQTLVFVPKLAFVSLGLVLLAHWMLRMLMQFCTLYLEKIASINS